MTVEIWRSVVGYDGYYEVSNRGRVRSLDRMVGGINGRAHMVYGRELRALHRLSGGVVVLSVDGEKVKHRVRDLVYRAFDGLDLEV